MSAVFPTMRKDGLRHARDYYLLYEKELARGGRSTVTDELKGYARAQAMKPDGGIPTWLELRAALAEKYGL